MKTFAAITAGILLVGLAAPQAPAQVRAGGGSSGLSMGLKREGRTNVDEERRLRLEILRAQAALNRAIAEARRTFVASPEFAAAVSELRAAGADYRAARTAALYVFRQSPEYVSARLRIEDLERELDAARSSSPAGIKTVSLALLDHRAALSRRETDILKTDDAYNEARYRRIDAGARVARLWKDFADQVAYDPACSAARE